MPKNDTFDLYLKDHIFTCSDKDCKECKEIYYCPECDALRLTHYETQDGKTSRKEGIVCNPGSHMIIVKKEQKYLTKEEWIKFWKNLTDKLVSEGKIKP